MGTTAEKLTYLNTTKQNLKTVINTTGAGLIDSSTFRSYANVLNNKILGAINGDVDLFEEYPKVSGNGTDLSLNGIVEGKMAITPQGVSSQDGEPTPTTPIPVKSVTGENSLVICNENLFNKNSITPNSYLDSDGNIITNTTWSISDYIPVIAGEDYVYRWLTTVGNAPMSCYYDKNKNFVSSFKQTTSGTKITIPSNVKFVRFTIETKNTDDLNTFMFVKGSTAPTTYVEHEEQNYQLSLGNIELCKIGDYQDYIYKSGDNWYKKQYVKSLSLNISDMNNSDNYPGWKGVTQIKEDFPNLSGIILSLKTTYMSNMTTFDMNGISVNTSGNNSILYFRKFIMYDLTQTQWKAQYPNLIVMLYYGLSEPIDVLITDTTLINQLNAIEEAYSYSGTTNITTTYEDGNEQMYLDIEALKNVWEVTE